MLKLIKIISEIKNLGKITPEIVYDLYDTLRKIIKHSHSISDLFEKYNYFKKNWEKNINGIKSIKDFIKYLDSTNQLASFYQDLLKIKNDSTP